MYSSDNWCFSNLMICERMTWLTGRCVCNVVMLIWQCDDRQRIIGRLSILPIITHLQVQTVPGCCDGGISAACTRSICLSHFRARCGWDCFRGALSCWPMCFVSLCVVINGTPVFNILLILNPLHRFNTYDTFEMVLSHNYEISLK